MSIHRSSSVCKPRRHFLHGPRGMATCSVLHSEAGSKERLSSSSGLCNNDPTIGSTLFYPPDNSRSYRPSQDCHEITREPVLQYALFTAFKVKRMTFRLWGHISRNLVLEMLC